MSKNPKRRNKHGIIKNEPLDLNEIEYVIYCRKSTEDDEKQKQSIPSQIQCCLDYALNPRNEINLRIRDDLYQRELSNDPLELSMEHDEGGKFKDIIDSAKPYFVVFESQSAKIPNKRPLWNKLIQLVDLGKIKGIISYAPDRQARNMLEAGKVITLVDENKLDLKYSNYHFENSPDGKMVLGMWFVFSKQYSDNLSKVVGRGNKLKISQGGHLGHFKLGYVASENGYYQPDKKSYPILKQAFHHKLYDGWTNEALADFLNENDVYRTYKDKDKVTIYNHKNIANLWRDKLYYGIHEVKGIEYDQRELNPYFGEPIITEEEYKLIMEMYKKRAVGTINNNNQKINEHLDPIGEHILISEDGHHFSFYPRKKEDFESRIDKLKKSGKEDACDIDVITANNQAFKPINTKGMGENKRTREITYNDILPHLINFFDSITITEANYNEYLKYFREVYKTDKKEIDKKNKEIDSKVQKIDEQITDIVSKTLGTKDEDDIKFRDSKLPILKREKSEWLSRKIALADNGDKLELALEEFLRLTKKIGLLFKQAHWVRRKKLIQLYISNLIIHRDNTVSIRVYPQLESLMGSMVEKNPTNPNYIIEIIQKHVMHCSKYEKAKFVSFVYEEMGGRLNRSEENIKYVQNAYGLR